MTSQVIAKRGRILTRCPHCGAKISSKEFIGTSMDFDRVFYRCKKCGLIIEIKNEE